MTNLAAGLLCGALAFAGCHAVKPGRDQTLTRARFFLESADARGMEIVLPASGVHLVVNVKPVLTEGDIANVEHARVELGQCLVLQLTPAAARDFYRLTASHQGRRLALVLNGSPVGARRIDGPIADGVLFVFLEVPDSTLPKLVEELKRSTVAFQRDLARKT